MLDFLEDDGTVMVPQESVSTSVETRLVPEQTKLLSRINGVTIEPAGQYNLEYIAVDTVVMQAGAWKGVEVIHKLQVNGLKIDDDETNISKAQAASVRKAKAAKKTLLVYDALAKGEIYNAAIAKQDVMDAGLLNRALAGADFTATYDVWEQEIKFRNDAGNLENAMNDDGTKKMRRGNYIGGVQNKSVAQELIKQEAEDLRIMKQAQNQPNAPVPDAVNLQPATQAPTAQQPAQQPVSSDDVPF